MRSWQLITLCDALACEREWQPVLDAAGDALRLMRERGAMRLYEPVSWRISAPRSSNSATWRRVVRRRQRELCSCANQSALWNPHSYAVLARAQLALEEPAADIASTLDEYAALLERTGFHLYEGELHELRARLAEREGREAEKVAALHRAYDCYTHFGMTAQAARVAKELES